MNFGDLSPFLTFGSARCAGTTYFRAASAALVGPIKKYFSPHRTLFYFTCSHRPENLAGSRAASPVS
jgi:hypothetical protein